jgi:transcriptional regulator with XRE-family HTH domain
MSEKLPDHVARLISRARLRLGWTYREAAEACNTTCGYIHMLERAQRCPSVIMAQFLISGLKLNQDEADSLREVSLSGVGRDFRPERVPHA